MNPIEQYLYHQKEPYQSIMLYVRSVILRTLSKVEEKYSYRIPYYHYNKKPMCYLNILKGTNYVDVAFVQGIFLENKFPQLKNDSNRKQVWIYTGKKFIARVFWLMCYTRLYKMRFKLLLFKPIHLHGI